MRSLIESLFDKDLVTKDLFESIIDRMDCKKYTPETTIEALDQLFKIGGKRYGFYSAGAKKEAFLKAIQKCNWVMLARKNYNDDSVDDYAIFWDHPRNNGLLLYYKIIWKGYWFCDDIDIGWAIDRETGAREVFDRMGNMHFDECILITDPKMKEDIKKRLKELTK